MRIAVLFCAWLVTITLPLASWAQATQPSWQTTPHGQLILRPFPHAPYPHPSREHGFKGRSTTYPADPHYTDSTVGIFIPAGYVQRDAVDYVVHFHGHNNHVSKVITQYKLAEQLSAARVNAILIVPQGPKDAADSGCGKLELDDGAFELLMGEVTDFLKSQRKIHTTRIGRIVLSSHSGGYKVTAAVLDHGGLAEHLGDVLLLDSSYGSLESFAHWAAASVDHRLVSLYTQHLADANKELMGMLDKAGTAYRSLAPDEAAVTDQTFARRGVSFMPTTVLHDEVPVEYFGRLVKTSGLSR
jgi:hypothetical protein